MSKVGICFQCNDTILRNRPSASVETLIKLPVEDLEDSSEIENSMEIESEENSSVVDMNRSTSSASFKIYNNSTELEFLFLCPLLLFVRFFDLHAVSAVRHGGRRTEQKEAVDKGTKTPVHRSLQ